MTGNPSVIPLSHKLNYIIFLQPEDYITSTKDINPIKMKVNDYIISIDGISTVLLYIIIHFILQAKL